MTATNDVELDQDLIPCKYVLKKKAIGSGSNSQVFEGKNKITGMHYAVKQYPRKLLYGLEESLQSEYQVLTKISRSHPNILTLVDSFETSDNLYLVTDLATGGELFDKIVNGNPTVGNSGHLNEPEAIQIVRALLSAVEYLHKNNVVHRDLKAENILFGTDNGSNILVADFGLARILRNSNEKLHDISGTLSYMAPEIFQKEKGHSFEVDMWAVGVIVYFMLCGYMPFDCESDSETQEAICSGDYSYDPPEYWEHVSPEAIDFIDKCFTINPEERITATEALDDAWLRENDSDSLRRILQRNASNTKLRQSIENLKLPCMHGSKRESNYSISTLSSANSKLSLIEKSRFASLQEGTTLQGSYCATPDVFSNINSPQSSQNVSRQSSSNNIVKLLKETK
ncbi:calcium/calmodulin-dependent protein kinase I [[Candida] railenensis]|uniref:Calcium/calmodulin-dependent protein kinase I n=1 Tax=[Candida] railenensis TaxID=45579 RepID=A0A9P0QMF7_9ASCO|nr:calcium/calmodulin-dependent protein kinase I [[Candida] railenensis]